jgi:hypothetical protein
MPTILLESLTTRMGMMARISGAGSAKCRGSALKMSDFHGFSV